MTLEPPRPTSLAPGLDPVASAALGSVLRDAALRYDADGVLRWASPGATRLLGFPVEDAFGTTFDPLQDAPVDVDLRTAADPTGTGPVRRLVRRPDGSTSWVEVWVHPVQTAEGASAGRVVVLHDVSAQVEVERRLQRLMENSSDVVYQRDAEGRIEWISPSVREVLGWDPEALVGTAATEIIDPDDHDLVRRVRARVDAGERVVGFLERFRRSDGEYRTMSAVSTPVLDDAGRVVAAIVGLRDVNDLIEAQQEAERGRAHLQATLDSELDPHVVLAAVRDDTGRIVDFRYTEANPAACRYNRVPHEELIGSLLLDLLPSQVESGMFARYVEAVETGVPVVIDDLALVQDLLGEVRRSDVRAVPFGDSLSLSWRDVTDRYLAAAALMRSEADFRLIAENASDLVFLLDQDSVVTWVSPSVRGLLGYEVSDMLGRPAPSYLHPDDIATRGSALTRVVDGRFAYEARFRCADGGWKWLSVTGRVETDDDGVVVRRVGSARDITDVVEARERQAESERRYRLLAENAADVVVLSDHSGPVWISPSVTAVLGYAPEELLGRTIVELAHPDDVVALRATREGLFRGEPFVARVRLRRKDGTYVWVDARAQLVEGEDDGPVHMVGSWRVVDEQVALEQELARQAIHDPLTGLHNRTWLLEELATDLRRADRAGTQLAVLFVDLDNFKVVNDSLGHAAGDEVLSRIARRVTRTLRPGDRASRIGGDEFVIVANDVRRPADAEAVAERMSAAIARDLTIENHTMHPTASIGIALSTPDATPSSLLRDADAAMFRAKATGRARWAFVDEELHARAMARLVAEAEIRTAIAERQFVVHYQPIVSLLDRTILGHEALVRWQHPERGLLPPVAFLPVAEETGLIVDIGVSVLEQVCDLLVARPDLPGTVSVNSSPMQVESVGWREHLLTTVRERGLDPARLVVEITETAVLSAIEDTRRDLQELRAVGMGIHVDDFGTGYSSLALLRDLPVTGIKLDKSFTDRVVGDHDARILAAGLAALADGLDILGIAEGVETADQAELLVELGWTRAQGYLFARPAAQPLLTLAAPSA